MEESEKINGKKRLPSIPSNFVTLRQLQDRWIKEKERKQKGKGEGEAEGEGEGEGPQQREEKEAIADERVGDEVSGRGSRKDGRFSRFKRDNGKRVAVGKPSDEKIAVPEDFDTELKDDELKKKKKQKNWKNKKKNGMEEKAGAANKGEEVKERAGNELRPASTESNEDNELIGDEVHAPKLSSVEEVNVKARREWQLRVNPRTHGRKAEIGQKFLAMSLDGEIRTGVQAPETASVEVRRKSQPNIIPRTHGRKAEIGQKFQAMSLDGEIRTGVQAPETASVEGRRESQPNLIPRSHGRKAERKFQSMSMDDDIRTRYYRRYGRQNVDFKFNHRRGIPELNRTYDGKFGRRRELNQRNEGMVWVKKGEVKDQNASGIQSSSQELY
ncbi:hypothetical protein V6N13_012398 [Hibiscus sabdariffa]|uniref:Uncharacterized protein n=1 Tax=Hibiscus sabdariffa TaxID=183260 RepID=A0ABR2SF23_9ROSI